MAHKNHNDPMENPLITTWRRNAMSFPQLSFMMETGAVPEAPEFVFRLFMDFQEEYVWSVKDAL